MQSASAHYWRVFLSLVNCIAEVCTYLLCTPLILLLHLHRTVRAGSETETMSVCAK